MPRTSRKPGLPASVSSASDREILYRTAIYARLSVEDNGKNPDSIESQIEYLEQYIAANPSMQQTAIFIDNGYTGTNFERPEFQRMIEAVQKGSINCIVVKDLSRLGRNYVETGEFLEKVCPFLSVRFIAVNDGYDSQATTNNTQLAASLSNIINDFYARDISRKVTSALRTKMEKGEYIGSWEKYGYLKDPADKNKLIVNPETAPVVQQIYLWRSEGMSYSAINRKLNELCIPSPGQYKADRGIITNNNQKSRRILWNRHIITDILQDICYLGHMAQRKNTQCLYAGLPYSSVEQQDWIVVENTHPAIIDQPLFERVQAINRASAAKTKAHLGKYHHLPKEKNIYKDKLVCADCGARLKLHRSISRNKDKVYFTFNCPTYGEHGTTGCTSRTKRKADLDETVFASIRTQMDLFIDTAQIIQSLSAKKQKMKKAPAGKNQIAGLQLKIKNLRSAIATLYVDRKDGLLTDEEYRMQKEKYQSEITRLEADLSQLNRDEVKTGKQLVQTKRWAAIVQKYSTADQLSEELLNACVERIRVHADGSLEITFNYMDEFVELLEMTRQLKREVA